MTAATDQGDNFTEYTDAASRALVPVVSVQMLTYNHESYLGAAIEGVLAQLTDFPIELIVGDDHSKDATLQVALRYQKQRPDLIRVVAGTSNVGERGNYRRVSLRARGEYIAFCDGDDYWTDPQKLQRQVDYLRAHLDTAIVHTNFDFLSSVAGKETLIRDYQRIRMKGGVASGRIFADLLLGNFIQTSTVCMRANVNAEYVKAVLKDDYPVCDWPLFLYAAARYRIAYLPESTTVYRRVVGSITNSGVAAKTRTVAGYIPMIEDCCDREGVSAKERARALAPLYRNLFSLSIFTDDLALFNRARAWLSINDPVYLKPWRRRLLPMLAELPVARWLLTRIQEMRDRRR